jgi:RNA polymerase sigma-70 factor (ECF subfamily)
MSDLTPNELTQAVQTRASLLVRLQDKGDEHSWREFYDIYGRLIFGYTLHFQISYAEAEDIVQEVCVKVFRQIERFDYSPERGRFRGWLKTITRNTVIDYLRRRQRRRNAKQEFHNTREAMVLEFEAKVDDDVWAWEWKKSLYENALERVRARVDPGTFKVFKLYALENVSMDTVMEESGLNANAVYAVKHRILKYIREEVERLQAEEGDYVE